MRNGVDHKAGQCTHHGAVDPNELEVATDVQFDAAAGLTGVVLTKLDGSGRGGVALAVASEAGLPIRFIGAGEGIRDLRPFNSFEFVEALLAR